MAKTRILVLLGMHRSGTSLTASILEALGVSLGDDLIPANDSNQKGYYEHAAITRVHININRILNRRAFSSAGFVEYPKDFIQRDDILECIDELEVIVRKELELARGMWGFKDPHTAKLLPVWKILFERLDIEPVYLLALRHPSEVAASTLKRDNVETAFGELLWVDNNVAALQNANFRVSLVVDYSRWFTDPVRQARRLLDLPGISWSGNDDELKELLDDRIDPSLYHQQRTEEAQLSLARDLYSSLLKVSVDGEAEDLPRQFVENYISAKAMFAPAWDRLEKVSNVDALAAAAKSVLAGKSGVALKKYQILRQRLAGESEGEASLVRLQKALDRIA